MNRISSSIERIGTRNNRISNTSDVACWPQTYSDTYIQLIRSCDQSVSDSKRTYHMSYGLFTLGMFAQMESIIIESIYSYFRMKLVILTAELLGRCFTSV